MNSILPDNQPSNASEFTVSEVSGALKRVVEDAFGNVRIRGEISGYRGQHSSGHAYFSLKDERARIEAVIWRGSFARLKFKPEEGMEVIATGKLTTYAGSSKYQIVIDRLEPAGAGALMALLEERRKKLEAEGLFAAERKRPLPFMPRVIGVITSPTGAVIRDIIHRITDRFPLHVIVWPVRVQGETTGPEVAVAVEGFNALQPGGVVARPDLLIVARGGGSLEDLWGFNDEVVVRAVAGSGIPVISAVGHETDWTLIDHAADMRAPTPTGAAELAVPVRAELEATVASLGARLQGAASRAADRRRQAVRAAARALPSVDSLLAMPRRRFDEAASRLERGLSENTARKRARFGGLRLSPSMLTRRLGEERRRATQARNRLVTSFRGLVGTARSRFDRDAGRISHVALSQRLALSSEKLGALTQRGDRAEATRLERSRVRLGQSTRLLETLSHRSVLERGYALVLDADGGLVKRAAALSKGDEVAIRFADGDVGALATGGEPPKAKPKSQPAPQAKPSDVQGDLF
ncbi:MAG: exodeoxyribonuclease VII large subunit [Rhizobiaceae bacterium]|nr:exodeoxyribonuclease VII large subunit [Rhizobiaceae bacterium]